MFIEVETKNINKQAQANKAVQKPSAKQVTKAINASGTPKSKNALIRLTDLTHEARLEILRSWQLSKQNMTDFCKKNGYHLDLFKYWKYKLQADLTTAHNQTESQAILEPHTDCSKNLSIKTAKIKQENTAANQLNNINQSDQATVAHKASQSGIENHIYFPNKYEFSFNDNLDIHKLKAICQLLASL